MFQTFAGGLIFWLVLACFISRHAFSFWQSFYDLIFLLRTFAGDLMIDKIVLMHIILLYDTRAQGHKE